MGYLIKYTYNIYYQKKKICFKIIHKLIHLFKDFKYFNYLYFYFPTRLKNLNL